MAPGIPKEKSRTVRSVHGPAMIHLPLQVSALPFREASVLSLQYTTVFPASLPDILGLPIAMAKCGSVANFAQEVTKEQWPLSVWGLHGQGVERFGRSETLLSSLYDHLSLL